MHKKIGRVKSPFSREKSLARSGKVDRFAFSLEGYGYKLPDSKTPICEAAATPVFLMSLRPQSNMK